MNSRKLSQSARQQDKRPAQEKPGSTSEWMRKGGFSVRCDLHAGQWQCRSCQGEVNGDRMYGPNCSYCRFV